MSSRVFLSSDRTFVSVRSDFDWTNFMSNLFAINFFHVIGRIHVSDIIANGQIFPSNPFAIQVSDSKNNVISICISKTNLDMCQPKMYK